VLFRSPKDQFIGSSLRDMPTITPEDIKIIWEHRDRLLAGERVKAFERKFDLLGKEIWLEVNPVVLQKEGKPFGFQLIIRDLTEHKKLEEQLHQAMKMEAIGMLAGGVAHDFNNNLTPIFGICGILKKELDKENSIYQDIVDIQDSADRCASLVRQLMAFSRKQVLEPVILNLNDIVCNMEKMLKRIIGEDIKLEKSLEKDLCNIKADAGQVEQIIANIVVNARDAMPQGGTLKIETKNEDVDVQFAKEHIEFQPGKFCLLQISDTGTGIGKSTIEHIFDPFFTTKERGKGTGLGLSTVYGIVKQSGGNILVESEPGKGTTFKVYLPLVETESKPAGKPVDVKDKSFGGSETILIVEDEDAVRKVTKRMLKDLGYKVLDASGGEEALMICDRQKGKIHLLLTDVVMPGMDGKDLAGFAAQKYPDLKIIFISGYTDEALSHHGGMSSEVDFLQKPFQVEKLAKKIRETLDR
jgi:signal transduction histidine kinase